MKSLLIFSLILGSQIVSAASLRPWTQELMKQTLNEDIAALNSNSSSKLMDLKSACKLTLNQKSGGGVVVSIESAGIKLSSVLMDSSKMAIKTSIQEDGRLVLRTYTLSFSSTVTTEIIEDKIASIAIETGTSKLTCAAE